MAKQNPKSQKKPKQTSGSAEKLPSRKSAQTLIQVAFPLQSTVVFFAALVMGLLLICMTTVFRSYFALNGMQSNLILCIGAALVLAAFGGQATVRVGGMIMAGVAALAFGLFIFLQQASNELVLQGRIYGFDFITYTSLDMRQKNYILGRTVQNHKNPRRSHYDFAIFKHEIDSPLLQVILTMKDPKTDTETERLLRVHTNDFEWAFGEHQRVEWELREKTNGPKRILTLYDLSRSKEIAHEGEIGLEAANIETSLNNMAFIKKTFALDIRPAIDVPLMLERLKAEEAPIRHGARDALSQAPIDSIPIIMNAFRLEISNYSMRLGICVALAQMLRADNNLAGAISSRLTEPDLNQLLDAAGDTDPATSLYATEFLMDLGDTRLPKLAIPRAAKINDQNARYNWLLVSQKGWSALSPEEKGELAMSLDEARQRSDQKSLQLFDNLQK